MASAAQSRAAKRKVNKGASALRKNRRSLTSLMCQNRQQGAQLAQQNSGRGIQALGRSFHISSVI
jgi:hypothetical protein